MNLLIASLVAATLGLAGAAHAQTAQTTVGTGPGVAAGVRTIDVSATITAIDKATRSVTLKGAQGREKTVVAGPEVKNFDQLNVGDQVDLRYTEALALELKKGSTAVPSRTEQAGAKAAALGSTPGAVGGRKVTIIGEVIDVNAATQVATVKGPQRTVDMQINDPAQFKRIAKGDRIEVTYVEAIAIGVVPKKK